jgi:uncharacterized repeat protein (TIGR01451 family)
MRGIIVTILILLGFGAQAFTVSIVKQDDPCGNSTGMVWAIPSGGVGTYTYAWSNGGTTNIMYDLPGGTYTVLVTDANGDTASASVTVEILPNLNVAPLLTSVQPDCLGSCDGRMRAFLNQNGGQEPYAYAYGFIGDPEVNSGTTSGAPFFFPACAGQTMWFTATDAFGCTDSTTFELDAPTVYTPPIVNVTNACAGGSNGSVEIDLTGWFFVDLVSTEMIGPGPEDTVAANGDYFFYDGLSPGEYQLRILQPSYGCVDPITLTIVDQTTCGALTGSAFVDLDFDCSNGPNDVPLVHQPIVVQPGNIVRLTNTSGGFNIPLEYGSYTVEQSNPDLVQLCPTATPVPFDISAVAPIQSVLLADSVIGGIDLSVHFSNSWAIPGFIQTTWITVTNQSPYLTAPISLSFDHETLFTFVGSSLSPVNTDPGNVSWELPALGPLAQQVVELQLQIPADPDLIGTTYAAAATISSAGDTDTANNEFEVVGSYDPNDITARTTLGSRTDYIFNTDEDIVYTIRFQNTGNFPAQNVYILDTLSELLDMARIEILGASHTFSAAYLDGRTLRFDFPNIQLPDSTNDEPNSHGFVSYRILPVPTLVIGDVIENTAAIYFDFNPAVITNTSVVTVQTVQHVDILSPTTIAVFPNPARSEVRVLRNGSPVQIKQGSIIAADGRQYPLAAERSLQGVINVEHLATGVYVLDIADVNGVTIRTRLVKDR